MPRLRIVSISFVKDEYTGLKRIRTDENGIREKEYITPVQGIIYRYSSLCYLDGHTKVWFEFKWTEKRSRFEIEFEEEVPDEFKNRKNIKGWEILQYE